VREAFLKEYKRRFDEYVAAKYPPCDVLPPEILKTPEQRKEFFGTQPPEKALYWEDNVIVEPKED
jgi:hypothetical protein